MPNSTISPVVQHLKKQLGVLEPLAFQPDGNIEVQCLYLIVQTPEVVKTGTLIDHTPILIPISLVDPEGYKYLIPIGNNHIPGLFGLDLNLLVSTDKKESMYFQKFKTILITNIMNFAKSTSEKDKSSYRQLIKTSLRSLWIDHTQKPFIHIQLKHIRFQRRLDLLVKNDPNSIVDHSLDTKLLLQLKQFIPKMTLF